MMRFYQEIADAAMGSAPGPAIDNLMSSNGYSSGYITLSKSATFEDITNNLHGVASGYGFEQLVALMTGGLFGGSNKTADDLAQNLQDPNADVLLLSSKSAHGGITDQTQSKSTIQDMKKVILCVLGISKGGSATGGAIHLKGPLESPRC